MVRAAGSLAIALAIAVVGCAPERGARLAMPADGGPGGDDAPPIDGGPGSDGGVVARDSCADSSAATDLATACGGKAPETLDEWEDCYARRRCEWKLCCEILDQFRDVADCMANDDPESGGQLAADRRERARAIAEGRAQINVPAFTQCLLHTNATRCNTALFDPACLTRFSGTIADGAACLTSIDCASPDAECVAGCSDACCTGTCQRKFRLGEACQLFDSCEPGLRCNGTRCVSGDAGTACTKGSVNQCDFGTFCDPKTLRCTPTLPVGSACTSDLQCSDNQTCVGLSINNSNPGVCTRVAAPGDHCDDFCFGNLYCDTGVEMCRNLPTQGQVCSTLIPCAGANTICNNGQCVLRADIGVPCGNQTCLPTLFCTSDVGDASPVCAARRDTGGACGDPSDCQSFLCSGTPTAPGMCLPWKDTCP